MRLVGGALVLAGGATAVWGVRAAMMKRRPFDLVAALAAPAGLLIALAGGVLIFEPTFLG